MTVGEALLLIQPYEKCLADWTSIVKGLHSVGIISRSVDESHGVS